MTVLSPSLIILATGDDVAVAAVREHPHPLRAAHAARVAAGDAANRVPIASPTQEAQRAAAG